VAALPGRVMKILLLTAVCAWLFATPSFGQTASLEDRIKIATNAVKLGCGVESKASDIEIHAEADGSITLKKLPSASAKGQLHYSNKETLGLLAAFQTQITSEGEKLSEKQLDCMKKFVDRIIDAVLPPTTGK
jgi:hypothetical protein